MSENVNNKRKPLVLKDYIFMGLLSLVFGLLYLLALYAGTATTGALTPTGYGILGYEPYYGIWFMAALAAVYILRRPGVGIVAEIIASVIEVILGNSFGPIVILSALIQGLGVELGFAIFRYKRYDYASTMLAAVFAMLFSFLWTGYRSAYWTMDFKIVGLIFIIRLASSLFFTGFLTKLLCDQLAKTGLLKTYPIGQVKA